MNPSSFGWIAKFFREFRGEKRSFFSSLDMVYPRLREVGFIYGTSIEAVIHTDTPITYSEEERTKINVFTALVVTYFETVEIGDEEECVKALITFYGYLDTKKSFFSFMDALHSDYEKLEGIIHTRVQTNESILKKNFSHLLTNALLYIDVLAFKYFLIHQESPFDYAVQLESTITNLVFLVLNSKDKKNKYDELLIHLFSSSIRYHNTSHETEVSFNTINLHRFTDVLEKKYILDLCCLTLWNDRDLDEYEQAFIITLADSLSFPKYIADDALTQVRHFIHTHQEAISFFNYSNPALHFYKQTSKTVSILILRNKNRLIKEIIESKDLVLLLGQSAIRDLSPEEKKQVKKQLLDICKTIPSLAIFILPGGALLLPLLIKFIPRLLPSAFNDNE